MNGMVLVYDWPDWTLGALSGAAMLAAGYLTYHSASQLAEPYSPRYMAARLEKVA